MENLTDQQIGQIGTVNGFTNTSMAIGLIGVTIGIIVSVLGMVALKSGVVQQSKFSPWKVLAGIWGAVLIVSVPGLTAFGANIMSPPAKTNAQTVVPAYESEDKTEVQTKIYVGSDDEDEIISIMGEANFQSAKDAMSEEPANAWDPKKSWYSYDKSLLYRTDADGNVDPCMQIRLRYVPKGTTTNSFGRAKTLDFTHPDFSEEKCGGPVESYSNPDEG